MRLKQKRVNKIKDYLAGVVEGDSFRIVVETPPSRLAKAGFPTIASVGMTMLPAIVGRVSRFNAEGKWEIHRDQPMESRYIRTIHWTWEVWNGPYETEERDGFFDQYRDCYPRDRIAPPSAELTLIMRDGRPHLASEVLVKDDASLERIKHVVNLILELFGECEIVAADLAALPNAMVTKVNWRMLPPGEHPWGKLKEHIEKSHGARSEGDLMFILDRQTTIYRFGPDRIYVGEGGFHDYVAYEFASLGIVVMESVRTDNAIYVFGQDWARVSRLTKAEVLSNGFHRERIIHSAGYKDRLADLFRVADVI